MPEQLTLPEVKEHLLIDADFDLDDNKLNRFITASRLHLEKVLGISLIPKTLQAISEMQVFELRNGPVGEILSAVDADGNTVSYETEGSLYPTITADSAPVTVVYEAGYAIGSLPEDIKLAMLMIVQGLYDNQPEMIRQAEDLVWGYCRNLFI